MALVESKTTNISLFPTLLQIVEEFITESQCVEFLNSINSNNLEIDNLLTNNGLTTFDKINSILDSFTGSFNLKNQILSQVKNYSLTSGLPKLKLTNSWINIQPKGSNIIRHVHASSIVSGALYLNADQKSSRLEFINPNPHIKMVAKSEYTEYNFDNFWIQPKTGMLVLFPSWLEHSSVGDNQNANRTVLSFNTFYKMTVK